MVKILVVYYRLPRRATLLDHLFSFKRYGNHDCYYLNTAFPAFPGWVHRVDFDLVVFHTLFLGARWHPRAFISLMELCTPLKSISGTKVALPQDEFAYTDLLGEFIRDYAIERVFSIAAPSEWPKIYPGIDPARVKFEAFRNYIS